MPTRKVFFLQGVRAFILALMMVLGASSSASSGLKKGERRSQVSFPQTQIQVGSHSLTVEVADNEERRRQGLMFREKMSQDQGMLFVFAQNQVLRFWMKNTFIPLSIAFIDENYQIVDIQNMEPVRSMMERAKTYSSRAEARLALEVNQGWFEQRNIKVGDPISIPKPEVSPLLLDLSKEGARQRSRRRSQ